MVGVAGIEPATLRLSSACSNQLSYTPASEAVSSFAISHQRTSRRADSHKAALLLWLVAFKLTALSVAKIELCDTFNKFFDRNIGNKSFLVYSLERR